MVPTIRLTTAAAAAPSQIVRARSIRSIRRR